MVNGNEIPLIIKALSSMKIDSTSKIFSSNSPIIKLIRNLRRENYVKLFYEALCAITNDEGSINKIEEFEMSGAEFCR